MDEPATIQIAPPPRWRRVRGGYLRTVWVVSLAGAVGISGLVVAGMLPALHWDSDLWLGEKLWAWAGLLVGGGLLMAMKRFRKTVLAMSAWRWMALLFVLAAAGRSAMLLTIPYIPTDDFFVYHQSGIGVAQRGGVTVGASPRGYHCFYPPGQVVTLGGLYRLFGDDALRQIPASSRIPETPEQWSAFYRAARIGMWFNVLLGSLTVVGIYAVGRRMLGEFPARVAGALACIVPACLFGSFLLGVEVAQTFWIVLALYAYARWVDKRPTMAPPVCVAESCAQQNVRVSQRSTTQKGRAIVGACLVGVCLGVASLFRPTFLPFAGLLAVHLLLTAADKRRALLSGAAMLLALAVVVSPWVVRNYRVTGAFIPISSNGGGMLYSGNNDLAQGSYTVEAWVELFEGSSDDATLHRLGTEKGLRWIRENPGRFAKLAVVKFSMFWGHDRDIAWWVLEAPAYFHQASWSPPDYAHTDIAPAARQAGTGLSTGVYLSILVAAAVGLWRSRRFLRDHGAWVSVILLAALFTAVHMVVESQAKYHYTLVPLLCLLAGLAVTPRENAVTSDK